MTVSTSTTFVELTNTILNNSRLTTVSFSTPRWIQTLTLTCMILIDISAFLGNLLVICAFFRTRRLQTVTNYFIASLAFADALVAIFVLPLSIYSYQRNRSWKLGLVLCDLWVSSDVLLCTSSILNLTCISLDRYMAITRPLTYTAYRSKFLARVMILLVWIVSVVITCPPIFGWRDSNRRQTVEQTHKCDLNTARGYVVYSALGSFYIPAIIMIFVYIRIFMVVYDRDNLINKFHKKNASSSQVPLRANQNGLTNAKNLSDGINENSNNLIKPQTKKSFACCFRFPKKSSTDHPTIVHSTSVPLYHNHYPNPERKQNGCIVYRFTNPNNTNTNSAPNTPSFLPKSKTFCRPCTLPTKKTMNLSDEVYNYRRNCLSHTSAEYQFRTGDSPCYELKTLENSLPPLIKCRSHSFEQSPTSPRRTFNTEFIQHQNLLTAVQSNEKQPNDINDILLSERETNNSPMAYYNQITRSLNELTTGLTENQATEIYRKPCSHILSKCSTTASVKSFSSTDQNLTNSSALSNVHEQKSLPEQTRVNRRMKPSRSPKSNPSAMLIENFKQQHKIPPNNNSSLKSSRSLTSIRRINVNDQKKSKCSRCCWCCYSCLTPLSRWYENKNKQGQDHTPNLSVTNDEDDDDKLSSNETNPRTPMIINSNSNIRALAQSSPSISLLSHHQSPSGGFSPSASNDVHRRERIRFMKEQKTAKILAIVVGGFILFWLPFFIMYVIPEQTISFNAQTVTLITWLGYFNSVINPFIYAYCSKQFRMAFWNITFGMCIQKSNALLPISVKNKQLHRRHMKA